MKSFHAEVAESARLYGDTHVLWLKSPDHMASITPGQFVMASIGESLDPLLGRPFSIFRRREDESGPEFGLLFTIVGRGTEWLSRRREGDLVRLVGPLGRGFEPRERVQKMLLVGSGINAAPLVGFADALVAEGREVTMVLGGRSEAHALPASLLPSEVELITTEEGTLGEAFQRLLPWCDQAFASGPNQMYEALFRVTRDAGTSKPVQALLQAQMVCGTGLCSSCAIFPRKGGVRLCCTDGPMFDLRDLYA